MNNKRSKLKPSQEELAARLNVSFATVNRWENDKAKPQGAARDAIAGALGAAGVRVDRVTTLEEAVQAAAAAAVTGDTVLLAPACASFDQFTDYAARGRAFRTAVEELP